MILNNIVWLTKEHLELPTHNRHWNLTDKCIEQRAWCKVGSLMEFGHNTCAWRLKAKGSTGHALKFLVIHAEGTRKLSPSLREKSNIMPWYPIRPNKWRLRIDFAFPEELPWPFGIWFCALRNQLQFKCAFV